MTLAGSGLAWLTGLTGGGAAITAMARSPLSGGGAAGPGVLLAPEAGVAAAAAGLAAPVVAVVPPLAGAAGAVGADAAGALPLAAAAGPPEAEPALAPASLTTGGAFELIELNSEPPVSVASTVFGAAAAGDGAAAMVMVAPPTLTLLWPLAKAVAAAAEKLPAPERALLATNAAPLSAPAEMAAAGAALVSEASGVGKVDGVVTTGAAGLAPPPPAKLTRLGPAMVALVAFWVAAGATTAAEVIA